MVFPAKKRGAPAAERGGPFNNKKSSSKKRTLSEKGRRKERFLVPKKPMWKILGLRV